MKSARSTFGRLKLTGTIKRHPDGFGFLIPDDPNQPDVYVPRNEMRGVMSNDSIEVDVEKERGGERLRGSVTKVLKRGVVTAIGRLHCKGDHAGWLVDESHGWGADLNVRMDNGLEAEDGDWVSVEILTYPDSPEGFTGRVVAVIGDSLDPLNDDRRVLYSHTIPQEFSPKCLAEAQAIPTKVPEQDIAGRRDLRHLDFVTIDGQTARDFDDAVFVDTTHNGFHLIVAIADVSHYVKPDSAIDNDAYERGTSTYFPNLVVPMLPEALSNELCSLKPHVTRLAMVADMDFDFAGELTRSEFYEAVIESKARITYGEAQEIIDGNVPKEFEPVAERVKKASDLAKIFMAKRFKEGSLNLEIGETELEIDEAGEPVDIIRAERLFSHKLIEEMMLAANVAVAKFFTKKQVPALYRIHEAPSPDSIELLEGFLEAFGFSKKLSGGRLQKKITRALQEFADKPQEHIINILTLRSMNQAKYSPRNVGHFGLGFEDYTHFTSPIRRYPDLIVHRLLKALVTQGKGYRLISEEDLESAGSFLSSCEQRSVKAERQLHGIKKARFMKRFVGQEFEGIISSVARFGVFVILRQFDVDGLVKVEELGGDRFEFDEQNLCLVGKKSGMSYHIGDPLRIQVAAVDVDLGKIDFILAEGQASARAPEKKAQPPKKRRKAKKNSRGVRKSRVSKSRRKS